MRKSGIIPAILIMTCFLMAVACNQNNQEQVADPMTAPSLPLVFEDQYFKKQSPNCKSDTVSCATVQARYLLAAGGPDSVRQKINDTLMHYLKAALAVYAVEDEEFRIPLDKVAERFIADYDGLRKDNPAYDMPWEVETAGKILYQSPKLVSIQYDTYSNTGGAHPNAFVCLLVLDKITGNKLKLSDFITDLSRLEKIAEKHFRNVHGLNQKQSLDDAGFFWGEAFSLPDNFAFLDGGLYLYYNNYDVAPYAAGPTEFTIPLSELEGLLSSKFF
ncbi:MAG: DUF3298 and DUF4163 domain-containing protein [Saprospiraceae bacterium]|nr:DUF3298 and DUF4163 domain-containing protein [Saprospiraceae bacterium]